MIAFGIKSSEAFAAADLIINTICSNGGNNEYDKYVMGKRKRYAAV